MENLEKLTKGEWEIDPDDNYSITAKQAPDDGGDIICMAPLEWEDSMKRWEANAKLIAAAPELLEALMPFAELLKQFDGQVGSRPTKGIIQAWHHNKHGEAQLTVEMLQNALNAIKKATK